MISPDRSFQEAVLLRREEGAVVGMGVCEIQIRRPLMAHLDASSWVREASRAVVGFIGTQVACLVTVGDKPGARMLRRCKDCEKGILSFKRTSFEAELVYSERPCFTNRTTEQNSKQIQQKLLGTIQRTPG